MIVDGALNVDAAAYMVLYSNKPNLTPPGPVNRVTSSVTVNEVDGSTGHGPLEALIRVTLGPMEVQILGR